MPTIASLLFERTDGITRLRLHRPAVLRAIDDATAHTDGALLETCAPRFGWA